ITVKDDSGLGAIHKIDVDEDGSVSFNTSADGATSNVTLEQPAYGDVKVDDNGKITYTPKPSFRGEDRFSYTTIEGGVEVTTEVIVTDNPVADAPSFERVTDSHGSVVPVTTEEAEAFAFNLHARSVSDKNDLSGPHDDFDNPGRLGEITLSGFPAGAVLLVDGMPAPIEPDADGTIRIKLTGADAPAHIANLESGLLELTV